ncbi:universal stress protein [Marilutibacter alkalisoli]|uniref:Universal stress protein n=1 Tax=Marilutibacter alkalisoli TaxID=2591633 RepID=A0A514BS59_9GAMM|nr:universal stress protein [Lysobacter alkalisoli]QDH70223.1 universal stress protein [Lysobacter alkalisoli]
MKILVPVDGSAISLRAARFAIKLGKQLNKPARITLLSVNLPLFPGVERKIGTTAVRRHYAENHEQMLAEARKVLARSGLETSERTEIGDPAEMILDVAAKEHCNLIVMGSHGRSMVKGLLLGSVSSKVIAQGKVPVTIVR